GLPPVPVGRRGRGGGAVRRRAPVAAGGCRPRASVFLTGPVLAGGGDGTELALPALGEWGRWHVELVRLRGAGRGRRRPCSGPSSGLPALRRAAGHPWPASPHGRRRPRPVRLPETTGGKERARMETESAG